MGSYLTSFLHSVPLFTHFCQVLPTLWKHKLLCNGQHKQSQEKRWMVTVSAPPPTHTHTHPSPSPSHPLPPHTHTLKKHQAAVVLLTREQGPASPAVCETCACMCRMNLRTKAIRQKLAPGALQSRVRRRPASSSRHRRQQSTASPRKWRRRLLSRWRTHHPPLTPRTNLPGREVSCVPDFFIADTAYRCLNGLLG